ncbi:hypothetical protein [Candidatus Nitrospira inopinata]|jgi:hypothetical protein|uniref:Uncharacterized protein n=1 Tax=Candidatus Nitrospira inopinata TaxID=1715989 RepID=A0A0S4KXE3_9BACT|nr:hypothetical protein [Candidatus Nitrospira inopinata]CUQ67997.1 conserved protein of unknown function [Candidatus Nitrospira inopinata]
MERRVASHTEEEEMNQRRKLLNAARRGDTKAISKLFELYQVRILSGEQLAKINRTAAYTAPVSSTKAEKSASRRTSKDARPGTREPAKVSPKERMKHSVKSSNGKPGKTHTVKKRKVKRK